jgi:heme exporter protein D
MSFDSVAALLAMGGHALYVWSAYALGVFVVIVSVVAPAQARRRFFAVEAERLARGRPEEG